MSEVLWGNNFTPVCWIEQQNNFENRSKLDKVKWKVVEVPSLTHTVYETKQEYGKNNRTRKINIISVLCCTLCHTNTYICFILKLITRNNKSCEKDEISDWNGYGNSSEILKLSFNKKKWLTRWMNRIYGMIWACGIIHENGRKCNGLLISQSRNTKWSTQWRLGRSSTARIVFDLRSPIWGRPGSFGESLPVVRGIISKPENVLRTCIYWHFRRSPTVWLQFEK